MVFEKRNIKEYFGPLKIYQRGERYVKFKVRDTIFTSFDKNFISIVDLIEAKQDNVFLDKLGITRTKKVGPDGSAKGYESVVPQYIEVIESKQKEIYNYQNQQNENLLIDSVRAILNNQLQENKVDTEEQKDKVDIEELEKILNEVR